MITRKSAYNISASEQKDYMDGVTEMIKSGEYVALVNVHLDMSHNMHSMSGMVGTRRFLSWHRDYLMKMETKLRAHKPNAFVPYWDWTQGGIPSWLTGFKPAIDGVKDVSGTGVPPHVDNTRTVPAAVSDTARISLLLSLADYDDFTRQLELDPHNKGHRLLGFPMTSLGSPCDPIFWMHHAMVDRVWSEWQKTHPGKGPLLTGKDATMDPWSENVAALDSISKLGYSYA